MPAWYWISTTSRYLLPPTLNTTRLLPQMLALAYWSLMSWGMCHVALTTSTNQLCNGPRASAHPGRSQNLYRLLFAKPLIDLGISRFGSIAQAGATAGQGDPFGGHRFGHRESSHPAVITALQSRAGSSMSLPPSASKSVARS